MASPDSGLTSMSPYDRNQTSTRQTLLELNTRKTLRQEPAYSSCSPVYPKTKTAADNSSHDDKEYTLTMASASVYKQRIQKAQDNSMHKLWVGLFKVLKSTKQNIRLKRMRRMIQKADGNKSRFWRAVPKAGSTKVRLRRAAPKADSGSPTSRQPVANSYYCRCKYCNFADQSIRTSDHENVAFNKPAQMSSRQSTSSGPVSAPACAAVNGVLSSLVNEAYTSLPNCIRTGNNDNRPWWTVDLQYVYTIPNIRLFISQGTVNRLSLGGVEVLVDGQVCYDFNKGGTVAEIRRFLIAHGLGRLLDCRKPLTGSIVRIYKRPEYIKNFGRFFVICELLIWVCKIGTYGKYPAACQRCPDDCQYTCDNYWGCDKRVLYNVAKGRPVTSNTRQSGSGNFLTDSTPAEDNSKCLETQTSVTRSVSWIQVTLDHSYLVFYVIVSGRVDCCSEQRLDNFYVFVMATLHEISFPPPASERCGYHSGGVPTKGKANITCTTSLWGKYVGVVKNSVQSLAVCELEVFGHLKFRLPLRANCKVSSKTIVCNGNATCDGGQCRSLPGEPCTQSSTCPRRGFCDNGFCKLNFNATCDPDQENQCSRPHMCDRTSRRCKLGIGSPCERGSSNCQFNVTCDLYVSQCKRKVKQTCTTPSECVSGAICSNNKCACNTETSSTVGDICLPKRGSTGGSCSTNTDCPENGVCENNVCGCESNYTIDGERLTCKVKASTRCAQNTDCPEGLKCENSICKLKIGSFCLGNEDNCESKAECELNYCKVGNGKSCVGHTTSCKSGNICFKGICGFQVGEKCTPEEVCANSICSDRDNLTCRLVPGQKCDSDFQLTDTPCQYATICERDQVCKLDFGYPCRNSSLCLSGGDCIARGGSEKKCRRPLGSMNCRSDEDCGINAICDSQKQCRLTKNSSCQAAPSLCLTGSLCVDGTCQCNPNVTDPQTARCDPNVKVAGGPCGKNNSCADTVALCKNVTCQCEGTFAIDPTDLTCGIPPGFQCTLDKSFSSCITGASCVGGFCVLDPGQSCVGANQGNCDILSICDTDRVCRLNLHQNCSGLPTQCKSGTVCDTLKRCKRKADGFCRDAVDCTAGSHCENNTCFCTEGISTLNGSICSVNDGQVGGKCNTNGSCVDPLANCINDTNLCECSPGYTPDPASLKCVKAIGGPCQSTSECLIGTACDLEQKKCLLSLGQLCDGENRKYCMTGSVCDTTRVCKLDLKGNCRGENRIFCRSGTFCDWLGECNYGVNDECNDTKEDSTCVAGAVCSNSLCTCDSEIASDYGALCEPNGGRYGGACDVLRSKCNVDNSICESYTCVCIPGYKPNRFFGCSGPPPPTAIDGGTLIGIVLGLSLLFLLLLLIFVWRRRRQSKDKAKAALAERRASMFAIQELKETISDVKEPDSSLDSEGKGESSGETGSQASEVSSSADPVEGIESNELAIQKPLDNLSAGV